MFLPYHDLITKVIVSYVWSCDSLLPVILWKDISNESKRALVLAPSYTNIVDWSMKASLGFLGFVSWQIGT